MTTRTPRESVGYGGELRDTGRAPWYGSCAGVSRARVRRTVRKEGPPARAAPEVPAGGLGDGVGGGGETRAAGARGDGGPRRAESRGGRGCRLSLSTADWTDGEG